MCAAPLIKYARFCSACGLPVDRPASSPGRKAAKWFHNPWFVLFMLFFVLGPFGIPLVWTTPRFSRPVKVALTVVMVFYTIALIAAVLHMVDAVTHSMRQLNDVLGY